MKYEIMPSEGIARTEARINEVFEIAKTCKYTSAQLNDMCIERIINPINARTPSGKRRHSVWMAGYVSGYIAALRNSIWRNDVEFCYDVDGILYSTHKDSDKPTTEHFYSRNEGHILSNAVGRHYWKGTDKVFS